jgi:hypothetical protein
MQTGRRTVRMVPVSAAAAMAFPRKRHVQHFTNRFRGNALTCRESHVNRQGDPLVGWSANLRGRLRYAERAKGLARCLTSSAA